MVNAFCHVGGKEYQRLYINLSIIGHCYIQWRRIDLFETMCMYTWTVFNDIHYMYLHVYMRNIMCSLKVLDHF